MNRKYFLLLLLLAPFLLAGNIQRHQMTMLSQYAAAGGGGCEGAPTINQTTQDDSWAVGNNSAQAQGGQGGFDPGSNETVCQVDIYINSITGDISGINWVMDVRLMNGTALGGSPTGTCVTTGQIIGSTGWEQFTGLACQISNGTDYAFVLRRSDTSYNGSNYLSVGTAGAGAGIDGTFRHWWDDDDTQSQDLTPDDTTIKIYYNE